MENKHFSLEIRKNNLLIRIFQITLGLLCLFIAVFWVIYNIKSVKADGTLWITAAFLCGFGAFQIYSGLGYADKFIDFGDEWIRLRKNSLLPVMLIKVEQIEKTEVFPLKVHIILKSSKRILIRFGVTDTEKVEQIKDEIISFSAANNINLEIKNEEF